ncbi:ROK family protein [Heyndrickxia acidiproducens]|uniref:ROK family protein n=1 Tax=Heyndrickxia acidiproducens TaxID=1121084 RepID=UPI00037E6CE3|nr:ROK family protein [Heyndrickxia acidiproducens]
MNTADQAFIKIQNQRVVLNEIIKHYPVSRAKLSKITQLNKATISSQTATLIDKNLVTEIGTGLSSGGRKPVMLVFNKNAGYAIGVDIGVNYILTILTDLEGGIVYSDYCEFADPSFEVVKPIIIERIRLVSSKAPDSPYGIIGIGAGVHGFVNRKQMVLFTPNSKWRNVDLKKLLEDHFDCPVLIDNEANAGAYGEKLFGSLKNCHNGIYVSIGIGIGLGIIVNDALYRGTEGFSGEMGHMSIDFNGKLCRCGNHGCWELYASEHAFYENLYNLKSKEDITLEKASKWIQENDNETIEQLELFGYYLGIGLTNIINTFNPEAIVLRSNLIEANPIVLNSIQSTIASRVSRFVHQSRQIYISQLNRNATALGSASFMIQDFLKGTGQLKM